MFRVKARDDVHGWMGASPDGLVAGMGSVAGQGGAWDGYVVEGARVLGGAGDGLVEIKCPFNRYVHQRCVHQLCVFVTSRICTRRRGRIHDAQPPALPQWYYMAQVQGLLDIFQRDWCNLFVWTPSAAALFHMPRDARYWALCFEVLAEFWWEHVVPARQEMEQGASALDVERFRYDRL